MRREDNSNTNYSTDGSSGEIDDGPDQDSEVEEEEFLSDDDSEGENLQRSQKDWERFLDIKEHFSRDGDGKTITTLLCKRCSLMTESTSGLQGLFSRRGYKHYRRNELFKSHANGCSLCSMIYTRSDGEYSEKNIRLYQGWTGHLWLKATGPEWYPISFQSHPLTGVEKTVISRIALLFNDYRSYKGKRQCIRRYNTSLVVFAFPGTSSCKFTSNVFRSEDMSVRKAEIEASIHLSDCLSGGEGHENCPRKAPDTPLPSRLIHVGSDFTAPSLHTTVPGESGNYIALSYCWGGPQPIILQKATLAATNSWDIPLSTFSQTIRDAILTVRRLGFKYLWVDALCIIQDDDKDKAREIQKMGSIYKNAALTIVAAGSNSSTTGFLALQKLQHHTRLSLLLPGGKFETIILLNETFEKHQDPLDSRGWTLQENLLSPRLLLFCQYDISWQCKSMSTSLLIRNSTGLSVQKTDFAQLISRNPMERPMPSEIHLGHISAPSPESTITPEDIWKNHLTWSLIVNDYSTRLLTVETDRLPAIFGIISELSFVWHHDTCISGMWESVLLQQLLWTHKYHQAKKAKTFTFDGSHEGTSSKDLIQPSWSWLSYPSGVEIRLNVQENLKPLSATAATSLLPKYPTTPTRQISTPALTLLAPILHYHDFRPKGFDERRAEFLDYEGVKISGHVEAKVVILFRAQPFLDRQDTFQWMGLLVVPVRKDIYERVGIFVWYQPSLPLPESRSIITLI